MNKKENEMAQIDYYPDWGGWALKEEDILWTGKPSIKYNELRREGKDMSKNLFLQGMTNAFFVSFYAYKFLKNNQYFIGLIILSLALFFPFIKDYYEFYSTRKTRYAISKDFIIFKFWRWFKFKYYAIPFDEIIKVSLVEDNAKKGLIHIVTKDRVEFSTYEIESQKRRDHPTMEYVEDPQTAMQLIKSRIKPDPHRKLVYTPPTVSFLTLRILRIILNGLIILFVIGLIEFYKNGFVIDGLHHPALWFTGTVLIFSRITLVRKFMISQELFVKIMILNFVFIALFLLIWYGST